MCPVLYEEQQALRRYNKSKRPIVVVPRALFLLKSYFQ